MGSALAWHDGRFRAGPAAAALLGALCIQTGTNLANDLYDFRKGADTRERLGPPRVLQRGWLRPATVRRAMAGAFVLAGLAGIYLAAVAGWPVIAIGLLSIGSGILYTAGPWALAYNALGDLFVFLFFGLVAVAGTYFVQAREVTVGAVVVAIPVGALATAILVVNNVRDLETDRSAGKRTLAVVLGRSWTRAWYGVLLLAAYSTPVALALTRRAAAWALLPILTAPLAAGAARAVWTRQDGPALNGALRSTARLLALFALLFAIGLALP